MIVSPREGAGNAGCPLHPQPRVQCVGSTRVSSPRSHREHPAFPHAMVLTAYFGLSPVIGLSCHRHPRIKALSVPGRADNASANLTPASRRQDHTTSPSAKISALVSSAACVHRIPPRVRDDRDTPLMWDETAQDIEVIWVRRKQEYFCKWDWTRNWQDSPSGKSH